MSPEFLGSALSDLSVPSDPRLLVGFAHADDSGVVALDRECALVQTVDFLTPMVDDAHTFGAIAAANALSDVYAMGGTPLSVLNILCFPSKVLDAQTLASILNGALSKVIEAGAVLAGGHSVRDDELKFGLSVTGLVHPDRVWKNDGARVGDVLLLTKPLGTGILTTARKRDAIEEDALSEAVASMLRLNAVAASVGRGFRVHSCTDITGNGLVGHAWEIARASQVGLSFDFERLPILAGALELAERGFVPGGARSNAGYVGSAWQASGLNEAEQGLVFDPQTSGGLLFSVHPADAKALCSALEQQGTTAVVVGEVLAQKACVRVQK